MRYISTRGRAPTLSFDDVLLAGLASDGGLYVPESWPAFDRAAIAALQGLPYAEVAQRVMTPFVSDSAVDLGPLLEDSYAGFRHPAVAPLVQLDRNLWLLELFHGQTLAFKDYALQALGRLFDHTLAARGRRMTVLGATSGDTGSAAIAACQDRAAIDLFMLYPRGRVSDVQRRQMTTVEAENIWAIAIDGSFDDCQDLVKALFGDEAFREQVALGAVNSINWARVAAQIVYYAAASTALGAPDRSVRFAVPTGNFGNIFAGHVARMMGFPIERLIIGSNSNDILHRFIAQGEMVVEDVTPTLSPSMDIQISSNFERLLFDLYDRDGAALTEAMQIFRKTGHLAPGADRAARAQDLFASARVDDSGTLAEIARVHAETGQVIDPHTAIGVHAARGSAEDGSGAPVVALATAHPAKFPDAVERAIGRRPGLPAHMADLLERRERSVDLPNDPARLKQFMLERLAAKGATA